MTTQLKCNVGKMKASLLLAKQALVQVGVSFRVAELSTESVVTNSVTLLLSPIASVKPTLVLC